MTATPYGGKALSLQPTHAMWSEPQGPDVDRVLILGQIGRLSLGEASAIGAQQKGGSMSDRYELSYEQLNAMIRGALETYINRREVEGASRDAAMAATLQVASVLAHDAKWQAMDLQAGVDEIAGFRRVSAALEVLREIRQVAANGDNRPSERLAWIIEAADGALGAR